jgi:hypothetical protein
MMVCGHIDLGASYNRRSESDSPENKGGKPMGRLLSKEDFIDNFGLNLSTRGVQEHVPRWKHAPGAYTSEELGILKDFEDLLRNSTLGAGSKFKKLKEIRSAG